ncbi:MAG TPA: hypothetical protein VGQ36_21845 [Thermoanaerobaculia bacterium]|jgi:hypothetical protein|nr:hypothetical protein [Thermoanaerobaculia bacterium]
MIALAACAGGPRPGVESVPGQGAITVQVIPNPIRATQVSGAMYDFPFEVIVRETGGRPVNVTRVSASVKGFGGMTLANEMYDAERLRALGFSTSVAANGELRYRFAPRREVPDERLFNGVSVQLTVDAVDDGGSPTSASTMVTVTR